MAPNAKPPAGALEAALAEYAKPFLAADPLASTEFIDAPFRAGWNALRERIVSDEAVERAQLALHGHANVIGSRARAALLAALGENAAGVAEEGERDG